MTEIKTHDSVYMWTAFAMLGTELNENVAEEFALLPIQHAILKRFSLMLRIHLYTIYIQYINTIPYNK